LSLSGLEQMVGTKLAKKGSSLGGDEEYRPKRERKQPMETDMSSSESNHSAEVGLSGPSMNLSLLHKTNSSDINAKHEKTHGSNSNTKSNKICSSLQCSGPSCQSALASLDSQVSPAKVYHSALVSLGSEVSPAKANVDYFVFNEANSKKVFSNFGDDKSHEVLLATAIVLVQDQKKNWKVCRALLDSASQCNFMTSKLHKFLRLPIFQTSIVISGINEKESEFQGKTITKIKSRVSDYENCLEFIVAPLITESLPVSTINIFEHAKHNLELADPKFYNSNEIDMLLGAEIFFEILETAQLSATEKTPLFHKTKFGWIASGRVYQNNRSNYHRNSYVFATVDLERRLDRMWSLDTCYNRREPMTTEERICEKDFVANTKRNDQGQFVVKLPLKENRNLLGDSYWIAFKRLSYLLKKLEKNPKLKSAYEAFIQEYRDLGQLEEVVDDSIKDPTRVQYLPHHCIIRESSSTTKLRVVFDGSAKTKSGVSLNDTQMIGAKQQRDLFEILLRFCNHRYAMTSDVEKMYRFIRVHPDHCDLQRILWVEDGQIKKYRLLTVTYGTASAPFLATRCVKELATIEKQNYPTACDVAENDIYMDDLMTGTDTIEEALELQKDIISLFSLAGFKWHKWCANDPRILENIDEKLREKFIQINEEDTVKALGMRWIPFEDNFIYSIEEIVRPFHTKRTVLSDLSKLFDPIGFLGPVLVRAKLFMQHLWIQKVEWDEPLNSEDQQSWMNYCSQLQSLNQLKIQRFNGKVPNAKILELHGFSDASSKAYGANIYLRVIDDKNNVSVKLLASKSRISPIKQQSIARMELCAALVLARLMVVVADALNMQSIKKYYWTDSTIVLSWIGTESAKLSVFVGNRTTEIQDLSGRSSWYKVNTHTNVADCLSRGLSADELISDETWWNGPLFLHTPEVINYASYEFPSIESDLPELRPTKITLTAQIKEKSFIQTLIEQFSSFQKLSFVFAFVLRFQKNCRSKVKVKGSLTPQELNESVQVLCKLIQKECFEEEYKLLSKGKPVQHSSKLKLLTPFMDEAQIIRVGGRLTNSFLVYDQKHQILLPQKNHLTELIIRNAHMTHMHSGIQATLAAVRQQFWPINGKAAVKKVVSRCVRCFRLNPKPSQQLMSDLPKGRVIPNRPFAICGCDYAGPFLIRNKNQRGGSNVKAYLAIFICFSTKCVHLEVVGDLSTDSFKAALSRFIARRGKVRQINSDNGKCFVGCHNENLELRNLYVTVTLKKISFNSVFKIKWNGSSSARTAHLMVEFGKAL
jgi:Pao retrotransposon peptidase/Putative peptidase (DUF1758)/Integrase zinc binding domain